MFYTGLLKRIIPFVLTFAAGLFIASFFVSLALPRVGEWRQSEPRRKCHEKRELMRENEVLREKNRSLRSENQELRRTADDWDGEALMDVVPPVVMDEHKPPPPPPPPTKRPKHSH